MSDIPEKGPGYVGRAWRCKDGVVRWVIGRTASTGNLHILWLSEGDSTWHHGGMRHPRSWPTAADAPMKEITPPQVGEVYRRCGIIGLPRLEKRGDPNWSALREGANATVWTFSPPRMFRREFMNNDERGDFSGLSAAQQWLREHGFSYGGMQREQPIGVLKGDFQISKWRDMTRAECFGLHGRIEPLNGTWRGKAGGAVVTLNDEVARDLEVAPSGGAGTA